MSRLRQKLQQKLKHKLKQKLKSRIQRNKVKKIRNRQHTRLLKTQKRMRKNTQNKKKAQAPRKKRNPPHPNKMNKKRKNPSDPMQAHSPLKNPNSNTKRVLSYLSVFTVESSCSYWSLSKWKPKNHMRLIWLTLCSKWPSTEPCNSILPKEMDTSHRQWTKRLGKISTGETV